jgi:hypothetical protein
MYQVNSNYLHGDSHDVWGIGTSTTTGSSRKQSLVATKRFSTLEITALLACQKIENDVCEEDDCPNFEGDNDPPELTADETFEDRLHELMMEEISEDDSFREAFIADLNKPSLDSSYKYPKISIMVRSDILTVQKTCAHFFYTGKSIR